MVRNLFLFILVLVLSACSTGETGTEVEILASGEISGYDYVGTFLNGDDVYAEAYRYNMQEAAWRMVLVRDGEIYKTFEGMPSMPKFSRDRKSMVYIDYLQFEVIGNVVVYDSESETETYYTDLAYGTSQDTVKDVEWYEDGSLLCVIGFATGTVSQGGDLYILDMETKEPAKVVLEGLISEWTDRPYEIVDVYVEEGGLELTLVEWTDDHYNEFCYTLHYISSDVFDDYAVNGSRYLNESSTETMKEDGLDLLPYSEFEGD